MEEQREESEFVGDCGVSLEEAGKGLGLSPQTETLDCEDVPQKESCIEEATEDGYTERQVKSDVGSVEDMVGSASEKTVRSAITESETERNKLECEGDTGTLEVKPVDEIEDTELCNDVERDNEAVKLVEVEMKEETAMSEIKSKNGGSHESAGEEETVTYVRNEVAKREVEDAEQNVQAEKPHQCLVDGEMFSVTEKKADHEKESTKTTEEDNNEMSVDSEQEKEDKEDPSYNEQGNLECETSDADQEKESETANEEDNNKMDICSKETVSEVGAATEISHEEETGEAMEIDYAAEGQVEKDVTVGDVLDNASNESAGGSIVQTQDVPIAEAERNDSNVVKEMEVERKDNGDMASDLTGTFESADSNAAPGEVESLEHNALFDPSSDITNFIDFTGVSSWSGNTQDLKPETGNVSLKEDKKATDIAKEVTTVDGETLKSVEATINSDKLNSEGIDIESDEARAAFETESLAAATDCSKEVSATMREEDDITHEDPNIGLNPKEDTEMEENPYNSDYADDGAGSNIKTNGVKRKADVLSEDSPGEGRKTVSLAKVSFAQRPSFKIGACIARAASQMAGSPSVLKGSNFGDETLSVESFVSQLHFAATDPVKENLVSDIAVGFFLDYRNSSVSQQVTPENILSKRAKSNAGGTEAFEFEEMGDTYWTDRVVHNGGEEQTPPTEKGNYQVVPVELKPAQVQRTRRPYRRRQSQIPLHSEKPADFDENAPAELIMNFPETNTIPSEKSLSKMFRHFGPIRETQTEVDKENNRARVVFKKGADAEVAYNSAGRFNIFGNQTVNYELKHTITETFKVQPYVVSLSEEDAALFLPS